LKSRLTTKCAEYAKVLDERTARVRVSGNGQS
jgi:hypothetical protein